MKCVVKDCTNHTHEGKFVGLLCSPCYAFIAGDRGGNWSQAYRNARHEIDEAVKAEREACAKQAENMDAAVLAMLNVTRQPIAIAAAIRARGEVPR
jgi:hypothetical protein